MGDHLQDLNLPKMEIERSKVHEWTANHCLLFDGGGC